MDNIPEEYLKCELSYEQESKTPKFEILSYDSDSSSNCGRKQQSTIRKDRRFNRLAQDSPQAKKWEQSFGEELA